MPVRKSIVGISIAVIALALIVGGCGGSAKKSNTTKAAVITDIGGLGDKGFNDLCAKGVRTAGTELDITPRVFISKSAADYIPNLSTASREGYNPVVVCGFLMGGDIEKAAAKFPDTSFGIIDYSQSWMKSDPQNLRGALFSENESGYLMGVAAAMASKTNTVSAVGGQAVPAVVSYLAGYKAGAEATKPGIKVVTAYSEDFVDQAKCKEIALNQIAAGSGAVFQAAGNCGLGALAAAKEKGVWGIGVDTDQGFLGPHVLTSALKKVDLGVFQMVKDVQDETFVGGEDSLFTLANDGVGFGEVSSAATNRQEIIDALTSVSKQIADGEITPPKE